MWIRPVTAVDIRLDDAWPDRALERAARAVRSLGERAPLGPACAAAISRVVALVRASQRLMRLLGRRARFRGVPLLPRPAVVSGCLSLRLSPQSFRRIDHSFDLGCLHAAVQPHAHALGADGARQARGAPALSFSRRSRARTRTGRGLCSSGQLNRCAGRSWGAQGGRTCPYERARRRAARTPLALSCRPWGGVCRGES